MSEQHDPLFAEFEPPSYEEWVDATVQSLKGRPFETIKTATVEGLTIRPFYTRADIVDEEVLERLPGQPPYRRGTQIDGYLAQPWLVAQVLPYARPRWFNQALLADLRRGQTAVYLDPALTDCHSLENLAKALNNVVFAAAPLFIAGGPAMLPLLAELLAQTGQSPADLRGGLLHDPLAVLVRQGSAALDDRYQESARWMRWALAEAPQFTTLAVNTAVYHGGGAQAVQELAFALATGVFHLRTLQDAGLSPAQIAGQMRFTFAIGGDFFVEIAKLRAARQLWAQVVEAFGGDEDAQKIKIHAETAVLNKSRLDPYVNMLRTTTEALAAAVGGVDSLLTAPFNQTFAAESDDFSRRIARNQQLILQEEAGLVRYVDPAGGSYYAEWLTDRLAQKAWVLFQEIEAQGGMVDALRAGLPQRWVQQTAVARAAKLAKQKDVLVGVNHYANVDERLPAGSSRTPRASEPPPTAALRITPIKPIRLAEPFEALRAWSDRYKQESGQPPQIFLANMGPPRQHRARADFTRSFFEAGGFALISPDGFATPESAAEAALASEARAVVICSTDETYPQLVPPLVQAIKSDQPAVIAILAGYPQDRVEAYKAAGIDAFIHLGADCLGLNRWLQEKYSKFAARRNL